MAVLLIHLYLISQSEPGNRLNAGRKPPSQLGRRSYMSNKLLYKRVRADFTECSEIDTATGDIAYWLDFEGKKFYEYTSNVITMGWNTVAEFLHDRRSNKSIWKLA